MKETRQFYSGYLINTFEKHEIHRSLQNSSVERNSEGTHRLFIRPLKIENAYYATKSVEKHSYYLNHNAVARPKKIKAHEFYSWIEKIEKIEKITFNNEFIHSSIDDEIKVFAKKLMLALNDELNNGACTSCLNEWYDKSRTAQNAIVDYTDFLQGSDNAKPLSTRSIKNFLYLIPIIYPYNPSISIDADTGCFTAIFDSSNKGLMTLLISSKGELHYSFAERGHKIFKISGTAKIKDPKDFTGFNKVLSML